MRTKHKTKKEERLDAYEKQGYFIENFDGRNYTISMPVEELK